MKKINLKFSLKPIGLVIGFGLALISCQPEENLNLADSESLEFIQYKNGDVIPGQYIVVLHPTGISSRKDLSYESAQASMRRIGTSLLAKYRISDENLGHVYGSSIEGFSVTLTAEQSEIISKDPAVKFIEQDRILSIAQKGKPGGGGGTAPAQGIPWGITRVGGFVNYTGTAKAYVLDTGIDLDHPDLNVATFGFNAFTSGKDGGSLDDGNGHGSHVAGTIAAKSNSIGVVGVAAGALVVPVKVLGATGSGSNSGVIAGVNYVGANGQVGDVANMSLGGGISTALDAAVINASSKVKFVLAAGNSGADANTSSPARANGPNIYTISAMNSSDVMASWSNFGNPPVDYAAPGVSILSTWKGGGYNTISGTSMAAPHVAGILLLGNINSGGTISGDKDSTPDQIAVR
jgi:hypothetical protein